MRFLKKTATQLFLNEKKCTLSDNLNVPTTEARTQTAVIKLNGTEIYLSNVWQLCMYRGVLINNCEIWLFEKLWILQKLSLNQLFPELLSKKIY